MNAASLSIGLLALLEAMQDDTAKDNVHRLRTTVRRLEVHLHDCPAKIAKSLKRLRKQAGKLRDIDVHLGLLKEPLLRTPTSQGNGSGAQEKLRKTLKAERNRQAGSLRELVADVAPRMEARLPALIQRAELDGASADQAHGRAQRVREQFLQWTRNVPEDPERLHQLRIKTKSLRYSLEPLERFEECAVLAGKMKEVQDAIGIWHDWATLQQIAESELKASEATRLSGALRTRAAREYRKARRTCESVRTWISSIPLEQNGNRSLRLVRKAG